MCGYTLIIAFVVALLISLCSIFIMIISKDSISEILSGTFLYLFSNIFSAFLIITVLFLRYIVLVSLKPISDETFEIEGRAAIELTIDEEGCKFYSPSDDEYITINNYVQDLSDGEEAYVTKSLVTYTIPHFLFWDNIGILKEENYDLHIQKNAKILIPFKE